MKVNTRDLRRKEFEKDHQLQSEAGKRCGKKRVRNNSFVISRLQAVAPGMVGWERVERLISLYSAEQRRLWCP